MPSFKSCFATTNSRSPSGVKTRSPLFNGHSSLNVLASTISTTMHLRRDGPRPSRTSIAMSGHMCWQPPTMHLQGFRLPAVVIYAETSQPQTQWSPAASTTGSSCHASDPCPPACDGVTRRSGPVAKAFCMPSALVLLRKSFWRVFACPQTG